MGIGAAIAGGVAAAGIGGAIISSNAAQSAAKTQANAATQASNNALAAGKQAQADLAPYAAVGQPAAATLSQITSNPAAGLAPYGLSGLTFQPTQAQLAATPGYQFDLNQGLQSTQNANAAQGLGVSGAALKGAASYATGLANNTLTTQQGIFQQNLNNVLNPLQFNANMGENAAAGQGNYGMQATANANQYATAGSAATAAGTMGSAKALNSGLQAVGNAPLNYLLYSNLLGSQTNPGFNGAASPQSSYAAGNSWVP